MITLFLNLHLAIENYINLWLLCWRISCCSCFKVFSYKYSLWSWFWLHQFISITSFHRYLICFISFRLRSQMFKFFEFHSNTCAMLFYYYFFIWNCVTSQPLTKMFIMRWTPFRLPDTALVPVTFNSLFPLLVNILDWNILDH